MARFCAEVIPTWENVSTQVITGKPLFIGAKHLRTNGKTHLSEKFKAEHRLGNTLFD